MCMYALMLVGYTFPLFIHHHGLYSAMLNYAMLNYAIQYWGNVGAVFGNTPHIVQVDDFSDLFAFRLIEGPSHILAFKNQDRPGAISEASTRCCGATVTTAYQEQCFYY